MIKFWLRSPKVSTLVNNIQGREISLKKGLKQRDPLSTLIVVIVSNDLHYMITKCWEKGLLKVWDAEMTLPWLSIYITQTIINIWEGMFSTGNVKIT